MFFYLFRFSTFYSIYYQRKRVTVRHWANSLFEDFCEFGLGMELANEKMRARIAEVVQRNPGSRAMLLQKLRKLLKAWIENMYDADKTKELAAADRSQSSKQGIAAGCPICKELKGLDSLSGEDVSQWIIGGDGASYDIGYGGLDHVIGFR